MTTRVDESVRLPTPPPQATEYERSLNLQLHLMVRDLMQRLWALETTTGIAPRKPSTLLALTQPTASKTATYTALITDFTLIADVTGGSFTITLPAANAAGAGFTPFLIIRRKDGSGNVLTITAAGADGLYSGATNLGFLTPGAGATTRLVSNGVADWFSV